MTCEYTIPAAGITLVGKPALKAWLAAGGLAQVLPERAMAAGIRVAQPRSRAGRAEIESMVAGIQTGWDNGPRVVIAADMNDPAIPQRVRDEDQKQRSAGATGEPEGFYYQGTVYLNASELATPQDAARVLFHEALGHYGLRGVFGESLAPILQNVATLRRAEVLAKAKAYGLDPSKPGELLAAAEEVLAEMAQTKPDAPLVQRLLAAIRTWLREHVPGFKNLALSDAEIIRDYLQPARAFVERGAQAGRDLAAPAFSRLQGRTTVDPETGFPEFENDRVRLAFPIEAERFEIIPQDGEKVLRYAIMPAQGFDVLGHTDLLVKDGRPVSLLDIEVYKDSGTGRRGGVGRATVEAALAAAGGDLNISNIVPEARAFWERLGIPEQNVEGAYDGTLNPETYRGGAGEGARGAARGGQAADAAADEGEVRFSRAKPAEPQGLVLPEQGLLDRVQAAVQDNMNRVRQVQERIQKLIGRKLPEVANYYGAEANRPGRIAARLEDAKTRLTGPLMEKLAKSGHSQAELSELLHAMHAQERNERIATINPDMPDGGSGMTNAEAAAILEKYRGNRVLHQLASDARAIARQTLDLKLAYGLIDADTHKALSEIYENYVPLKGDGEFGPKIKRAMGHEAREEHILENIARDYDQAVVVGEKNLARQSLLAMVLQNPDQELWTVGMPPRGRFIAGKTYEVRRNGKTEATFSSAPQVSAFLEGKGAEAGQYEVVDSGGERVQQFVKPLQDNEVMVYVDGRPVRIQIHGDDTLARQLRPLDQGRMNPILEGMRSLNRYLSKIYTGYNPSFIIRNTVRDAITGTVNMLGNEGAAITAKAWANYPAAVAAMGKFAATGQAPDGKTGRYLQEYRANGGKTGASWMSDLEEHGKTLERMFEDAYGARGYLRDGKKLAAAKVAGRKIVGGMAHVVEIGNQATENGLRLALFMAMRDSGATAGQAAQAAKSVTVDFDRKGAMTGALGAIYLFFNPAVQGTANALKTLVKGEHKQEAWAALGALALLGLYAAGQGMDDDRDRWLGEKWQTRSKNLILKVGDKHLQVPMSQEFAPFYAFGAAMAEAMRGESKMAAAGRMMASFLDAYFPLQGFYDYDSDNHAMDAVSSAIPTVIKPSFQSAVNRNSFGSQIVPENEFTKDRPDNLKMARGTKNTAYDTAAQAIAGAGEALGEGKYENGLTKVSPETLKHFWRTYTGGLGQFLTDAAGVARMTAEDAGQVASSDVPIVKDFLKDNDVKAVRGRFYDQVKEAKAAAEEFRQAKKAGDGEAIDKIMERPERAELLGLDRLIRHTQAAAAKLRDQAVDINADQSMAPAQKREALKELERQEEEIYRAALQAFK